MEIGSFLSLDLRSTGEYHKQESNISRLNSARAGIYHACRIYNCQSIHLPYYLCPTVKKFLKNHSINIKYYYINSSFEPVDLQQEDGHAVLIVNYFGILSEKKIKMLSDQFKGVIIDNSAAFYAKPIETAINIYSPRKFFGVPDGCYVIGENADIYLNQYEQDYSSPTSSFLLSRIELNLHETYKDRMINEKRIDESDILRMSKLTQELLGNIDYTGIKNKRRKNFNFAHELFKKINLIDPSLFIDEECNPLVYPLVIEDATMHEKLKTNNIFTGRWWNHVLSEVQGNTFEAYFSKYMIPLPIDQRYGKNDLLHMYNVIIGIFNDDGGSGQVKK